MKKLLILTTFLSSFMMSSVAHAEWTKVSESVKGDIGYVDLGRIKKHDGKIYFWFLVDLLKPNSVGMISFLSYIEGECGRFRYRELTTTFYEGAMGSGKISSKANNPSDWSYPPPNSTSEIVLKTVCNHQSMQ